MSDFSNSSDASQYRADREYDNTDRSTSVLKSIRELPNSQPSRPVLNEEQAKQATTALLNKEYMKLQFPRIMKSRVDPVISRQHIGLVSFIPSKDAIPDAEGCYGIMKFRGAFATEAEASEWGVHLITNVDSYSEINVCYIGREFPLMKDDSMYTASTREVDIRQKMDDVHKADFKKKREEENKQVKEIQERRERLLDHNHKSEIEKAVTDIDLYIELRVKKAHALMAKDEAEKALEKSCEIIRKTDAILEKIESEHPNYKDEYLERYNNALTAVGSNQANNPIIPYMVSEDQLKKKAEESKE